MIEGLETLRAEGVVAGLSGGRAWVGLSTQIEVIEWATQTAMRMQTRRQDSEALEMWAAWP